MRKIGYVLKRLRTIDYKQLFDECRIVSERSGKNRLAILVDMMRCGVVYGAGGMDYCNFYFERLTPEERATFITRRINVEYNEAMNDPAVEPIFHDKILMYETYKPFIRREFMELTSENEDAFADFLATHGAIIVKPKDGTGGFGVEKIQLADVADVHTLYQRLLKNGQVVIEEVVDQHPAMNAMCDQAVNTLRIVTVRKNDVAHVLATVLRIGSGRNNVDNFHSQGMAAIIDERGVLIKPAIDKDNNIFTEHPVSGTTIVGFQIPNYKDALMLVKEASEVVPEMGYIGWDVAMTPNGPLLIEANNYPGYDVTQSAGLSDGTRTGDKKRYDAAIYG